ncbi:MAG: Fatty acid oxidation complex subunit alpha [Pseudomonadota bacterium]
MISYTCSGGIASLHLNAPAKGNALSADMVDALLQAVHEASNDASVHSLVLTGEGRHLCTGFDLSDLETQSEGDLLLRFVRIEQVLDALWRAPVRTIAYAQGRTWGAGADLFAACDVRWACPQATFRFPGAGFGLVLGTRRLAQRVGLSAARDWVSLGQEVNAESARAAGLATRVHGLTEAEGAEGQGRENGHSGLGGLRQTMIEQACTLPMVDRSTLAALRAASNPNAARDADADLAALVRSAARPGLKARIADYRARTRAASAKPTSPPVKRAP